jgi:hypothetical protein
MVFLAHRLRIAASVIAVMLAVGWSLSSIAPAQGLDPANEQRCLDAERDLLAEAQKQGLGKIVGINDNLLLIEDQRLTVAQLAEEQRAVFEHACRALLAGDKMSSSTLPTRSRESTAATLVMSSGPWSAS